MRPNQVVAAAAADAGQATAPENLLAMALGTRHQVVTELAPRFAPVHVTDMTRLLRVEWGETGIIRMQDNYLDRSAAGSSRSRQRHAARL